MSVQIMNLKMKKTLKFEMQLNTLWMSPAWKPKAPLIQCKGVQHFCYEIAFEWLFYISKATLSSIGDIFTQDILYITVEKTAVKQRCTANGREWVWIPETMNIKTACCQEKMIIAREKISWNPNKVFRTSQRELALSTKACQTRIKIY